MSALISFTRLGSALWLEKNREIYNKTMEQTWLHLLESKKCVFGMPFWSAWIMNGWPCLLKGLHFYLFLFIIKRRYIFIYIEIYLTIKLSYSKLAYISFEKCSKKNINENNKKQQLMRQFVASKNNLGWAKDFVAWDKGQYLSPFQVQKNNQTGFH